MIKKRIYMLLVCLFFAFVPVFSVHASQDVEQKTVRIGFFSADGYHVIDEDGTMRGYGYDFYQMLLRYNNWKYEYIGYDCNWGDMLDMLDRGEIDMVTLANKLPEREEKFAYSDKSIGTSSTIMTISSDNVNIIPGDYATYEGASIGLVKGSSHNEKFEEYAKQKGFSYRKVYYEDIKDLLEDLKAGKNIDIAVTSNMRLLQDEVILDEFNANEYYAIVKKGNDELLSQINSGIAQLNVYSPDWRTSLFEKYYSDINSEVISFSVEEREYLQQLKENNETIKVAMNPELKPYSYFEDGKAKGIAPVIFKEIAKRLGIHYEILESTDRWEYKKQLQSGEADVDLTAYLDYGLAQKYNLKETDAYITSAMALLTTKEANMNKDDMVLAVVEDPTEYIGLNDDLVYPYQYKEYHSIVDCIKAVQNGDVDATYQYVYIAEQAIAQDYKNQLKYTILPEYSFEMCLGVKNEKDYRLLSVLNKGVNSLRQSYIQGIMLDESSKMEQNRSIYALVYDHPMLVTLLVAFTILLGSFAIIMIIINHAQKNKLLVSKEMDRFIGYVCESYELVVEINLATSIRTIYQMKEDLIVEKQTHIPFDVTYFEKLVMEDDLSIVVDAFSEEHIDKMIAEGGTQSYIECRLKDDKGNAIWHSYIIKAIKKDKQHPRNFIIFKKNIHEVKLGEEEQKQILMDALETAKNASAAKGQFLSRMSHEIRTPLNAVIGYIDIAKESKENTEKVMYCIENSRVAARHLLSIINDVLDISSIESGRMKIAHEEFNLKNQLTSLSAMFFQQAKEKGVHFEVNLENVLKEWVIGDSLRINQVLMNLLSNAIKFTSENGKVSLTITQLCEEDGKVFMKFEVKDTGIGMSSEYRKRLFQPFEQESATTAQKYGGTGLGLSITYNLVQMMGGSIDVNSIPGEGSSFKVAFHFEVGHGHEIDKQQDYSKVSVLIVEEDESSCKYMTGLLDRCKVNNDVVNSANKAIKRIRGRARTEYAYNMCLIDLNMQHINGIEVAQRIQKECTEAMPVIIATAYDVTEFSDAAMDAGISRVIAKPLFQSTMFDLLVSLYGKYEPVEDREVNVESLKGLKVLLAEDNPMNLEIATEILKKASMEVEAVTDGQQAVDTFVNHPPRTYDVILMDVQMPVLDGYQATTKIRNSKHKEASSIPIIAMTANAFAEDVNAALVSGMNGHIAKPVDYEKLYTVLNKFCKREGRKCE